MSKKINIRPTSSVYATYKRLSYQPWTAIAEFVDNSTQSFYDHKEELMSLKYSRGLTITIDYFTDLSCGDRIVICDDAYGMEWDDFQRAIILDKPPVNTNGRNEFGMGLKTAACWFGEVWSVESTRLNSKNKYSATINIDELGKYKTEEIDVEEETVNPKDHFTKITITHLNKKIIGGRTVSKIKELLSSIYREDIRSEYIKIFYNGTQLQFKEAPIFKEEIDGQIREWKKDIEFSINHEGKKLNVHGFVAIRIPASVKDAGLTLLRRGRVIVGGSEKNYRPSELFGDSNTNTYQRLYGELHMDNWPVTQAKDNFDWHSSGLEEEFIEELKKYTQDYKRKAESIRVREKTTTSEIANTAISSLTNTGVIKNVDIKIIDNSINKEIKNISVSDFKSDLMEEDAEVSIATEDNDGVIIEGGTQIDYKFTYKNNEYLFHITLDLYNPTMRWLLVEANSETEYSVTINMKHQFFKPMIDKTEFQPLLISISIALCLAEIESIKTSTDGRIDPSEIRLKMNEILENINSGEEK